jgi:hypothetical protein
MIIRLYHDYYCLNADELGIELSNYNRLRKLEIARMVEDACILKCRAHCNADDKVEKFIKKELVKERYKDKVVKVRIYDFMLYLTDEKYDFTEFIYSRNYEKREYLNGRELLDELVFTES